MVLPGLAVLDLSGNPTVTATEGYRLRLLYRLPRLKVLDGCPASAEEVAAAHTSHAGRLTLSMLVSTWSGAGWCGHLLLFVARVYCMKPS